MVKGAHVNALVLPYFFLPFLSFLAFLSFFASFFLPFAMLPSYTVTILAKDCWAGMSSGTRMVVRIIA